MKKVSTELIQLMKGVNRCEQVWEGVDLYGQDTYRLKWTTIRVRHLQAKLGQEKLLIGQENRAIYFLYKVYLKKYFPLWYVCEVGRECQPIFIQ